MRSLFRFFAQNYFFLLFLILQAISLTLVVRYNNYQRVKFLNSSNYMIAHIYQGFNAVSDFFRLKQTNMDLAEENARLKNRLQKFTINEGYVRVDSILSDSVLYSFLPAKVINNSVNKQNNYITINKGRKDGVKPEMGVIGPGGIVGVITDVSDHFATGPTILNKRWRVSAKINKSNYFGSLSWNGKNYRLAQLNEIPFHVELAVGDTIITSGFSSIFPEGIMIGQIESFNIESGQNFYRIEVRLSTDFMSLTYVDVVSNNYADELNRLQRNNK